MPGPADPTHDVAKERRATRKAAAACLARQRHKTFVNSLQDQGNAMRGRIAQLKRRKGFSVSVCQRGGPGGAPSRPFGRALATFSSYGP